MKVDICFLTNFKSHWTVYAHTHTQSNEARTSISAVANILNSFPFAKGIKVTFLKQHTPVSFVNPIKCFLLNISIIGREMDSLDSLVNKDVLNLDKQMPFFKIKL